MANSSCSEDVTCAGVSLRIYVAEACVAAVAADKFSLVPIPTGAAIRLSIEVECGLPHKSHELAKPLVLHTFQICFDMEARNSRASEAQRATVAAS